LDVTKNRCYCRAFVNPYSYTYEKKTRGVSLGLQHIQKVGEGEPFGNAVSVDEAFDEVDNSVWEDNYVADVEGPEGPDDLL
jgi:hypothetical protein